METEYTLKTLQMHVRSSSFDWPRGAASAARDSGVVFRRFRAADLRSPRPTCCMLMGRLNRQKPVMATQLTADDRNIVKQLRRAAISEQETEMKKTKIIFCVMSSIGQLQQPRRARVLITRTPEEHLSSESILLPVF